MDTALNGSTGVKPDAISSTVPAPVVTASAAPAAITPAVASSAEIAPTPDTRGETAGSTEYGYLIVFALEAGGALPVPGAKVKIYSGDPDSVDSGKAGVIAEFVTGRDGKTPKLRLPSAPKELSQQPLPDTHGGGVKPFKLYNVTTELEGYYRTINRNVPIYPAITSIQPVYMLPIALGGELGTNPTELTRITDGEPPEL